jgi:hypothetical protein
MATISAFRQPSAAPHLQAVPQAAPVEAMMEAPAHFEEQPAPEPVAMQPQPAPSKIAPTRMPHTTGQGFIAPNQRNALFAEPQRPVASQPTYNAAEPRPSLFSQMTGAFRRKAVGGVAAPAHHAEMPTQQRMEPAHEQADLRVAVRQTSAAEEALEIPAFLRRQQSTH